jgi:hypothetical protein
MLEPFPSILDVSRSFAGRMRDERAVGAARLLSVLVGVQVEDRLTIDVPTFTNTVQDLSRFGVTSGQFRHSRLEREPPGDFIRLRFASL